MSSTIAELEGQEEKILLGQVLTCYFMKENSEITHESFIETVKDSIKIDANLSFVIVYLINGNNMSAVRLWKKLKKHPKNTE